MATAGIMKSMNDAQKEPSKQVPASPGKSIASLLQGKINLPHSVETLKSKFDNGKPFRHLVIDDMFSDDMLDKLVEEIPLITRGHWVYENNERLRTYNLRSAVELGDVGFQLIAFLHSAAFLYFLSELTGIWELLPDPYLQGGGYHVMPIGGKFDVHVDRNTAYETGLNRRLSLIVYLNKNWKHEYGGQLELWNGDATRCEEIIEPLFNRTVLFEIVEKGYHGIPKHIACPKGRSRDCFLVYYHTARAAGEDAAPPHTSIYGPSLYEKKGSATRKFFRGLTPPVLLQALKNVQCAKRKGRS
jgi:2OG-Fe(II) oxygenase superfamily